MPLTEIEIRTALKDCFDPDLRINIVDLGLVYDIHIEEDKDAPGTGIPGVPPRFRVNIDLTLTAREHPAEGQIVALIENRLYGMPAVSKAQISLVWEPQWTPERITPEGRRQLGLNTPRGNNLIQIT